jgi:hypothetical protein
MAHLFTQRVAEYLAERHNTECRDDIRNGIEFEYRARRSGLGKTDLGKTDWLVWCAASDHYVDFDQRGVADESAVFRYDLAAPNDPRIILITDYVGKRSALPRLSYVVLPQHKRGNR